MYNRISIVAADGSVSVRDMAFSQTIELLRGLDKSEREAFWRKQETKLANGASAYLMNEGA